MPHSPGRFQRAIGAPQLDEYWRSCPIYRFSGTRHTCISYVGKILKSMPSILDFFMVVRWVISRLVFCLIQQMRSRWKAPNAPESMGPAASAASTIIVMRLTGSYNGHLWDTFGHLWDTYGHRVERTSNGALPTRKPVGIAHGCSTTLHLYGGRCGASK